MTQRNAALLALLAAFPVFAKEARVPAGELPVAAEVDVVVIGGTSAGVEAAAEAARSGAKVFLAAPRPYLGEDICGTYRLWLEPGDQPLTELARAAFASQKSATAEQSAFAALPFAYTADKKSARAHADTAQQTKLADGNWGIANTESVQFDSDVVLTADLGAVKPITAAHVLAYQRGQTFAIASFTVSVSDDQQAWRAFGTFTNTTINSFDQEDPAFPMSVKAAAKARYVRFEIRKLPAAERQLLGEIIVEGDAPAQPKVAAAPATIQLATPLQVKRTFDDALIKNGVQFLTGSFASEVLRDDQGNIAGVVIANRSGRQAVIAKVVIDATERAVFARMAGAQFSPYPAGPQKFRRVVVGGEPREGKNLSLVNRESALVARGGKGNAVPVHEYEIEIPMADGSVASFAEAEQIARDATWTPAAMDGSEVLFQVSPEVLVAQAQQSGAWSGAEKIDPACFVPKNIERLFVLGGNAAVSREAAAQLVRPVHAMAVGARIGKIAALAAAKLPEPRGVKVAGGVARETVAGEARSVSSEFNIRRTGRTIVEEAHTLPVIGEFDVVVAGGGTGGAGAGIGAARQKANTLVVEYLHGLGGVGTMGYISTYYHGNRVGFTHEVDTGVAAYSPEPPKNTAAWNPEHKMEWWRSALRKAGGHLWQGAFASGALVESNVLKGIIVHTAHGRGVVLAKTVVDSTGNADIAAAAGATCLYTGADDLAVQGTGLPRRDLGQRYVNTDYTYVDETDAHDIWRALVTAKQKYKEAYDLGQLIDSRERRSIVGDYTMTPMDQWFGRRYTDTVVIAKSNFDTHGYVLHPLYMLRPPEKQGFTVYIPWRCLLPRGMDRIIVTGLGASVNRDASPLTRMQADIQNQGYASGVAAARIAEQNIATRQLDMKELQQHLVEVAILPPDISSAKDMFPLPDRWITDAVDNVVNDYEALEVLLAEWDKSAPLLAKAHAAETDADSKLIYAHVLGMMGDAAGTETLVKKVTATPWDKGWRLKGMGQFGASLSPLDSYIIALGRTRSPAALKPLLEKAALLEPASEFSHFRSIAIALESIGDKSAAPVLAALLRKPGLSGHAVTNIATALKEVPASTTDESVRQKMLTELYLARALYRCGDHEGLAAKILGDYSRDLHGHYARHAHAVLQTPAGTPFAKPTL